METTNAAGMVYDYNTGKYQRNELATSYVPLDKLDPAIRNQLDAAATIIRHQQEEIEQLRKMVEELYYPMRGATHG